MEIVIYTTKHGQIAQTTTLPHLKEKRATVRFVQGNKIENERECVCVREKERKKAIERERN